MAHFTQDFIDFFIELAGNNTKEWFDENRKRYHTSVKTPFDKFVDLLIDEMRKTNKDLNITYKDAVFRINRDIRFSKDKTPYKLNRSAIISPGGKKDKTTPGMYFEFTPEHIRIYTGAHMLDKHQLQSVREEITDNLTQFNKIITNKKFKAVFGEVYGDKNKRILKEFNEAAEKQPLLFNKNLYVYATLPVETILKEDLLEQLIQTYKVAEPFAKFLAKPIEFAS